MSTQQLTIDGMTCGGCARAVRAALVAIEGVTSADVQHESGTATISVQHEIPREQIASALEEAGFALK